MYRVKCTTAIAEFPFFHGECVNLTVSHEQFQLFIKYNKFFRRPIVKFAFARVNFRKATFSKELLIQSTYSLNFLSGYCSIWEQLLLKGCF